MQGKPGRHNHEYSATNLAPQASAFLMAFLLVKAFRLKRHEAMIPIVAKEKPVKRQVFIQSELLADVAVLAVEHDIQVGELRKALYGQLPPVEEEVFVFIEDEDDERAFEILVEIPEGLRVHLHRLKGIDVTVRYAGRDVRRTFRPSATVARVKKWSTHELGITPSDAAELMLQITGTDNRPDGDTHIGALVKAPTKVLSFDLVPSPRVNG
jgi:hypothetical protein